ncbi:MAG TPA: lipopolysaccharide kinase InaA family protein [Gemmatimonadaceae bacterium]|nr:lipopolysaccharide kinase InaA family protein [Gemmatimonadaceae bacterium]
MPADAAPAGYVRVAAGDRVAVVLAAHEEDARRMLAKGSLYDAAASDPGARPLHGRGVAYAIALPVSGTRAVVRHNRHGGVLAPLTRDLFLPPTRAPRELAIAQRLRELGVPTPEVLMYGTSPAPFPFRRADVVTREVDGGRDLSAFMARDVGQSARTDAWSATCALVRAMNDAGARHHDLNVKNVLLAPSAAGLVAWLLDVDRVTFGAPGSAEIAAGNVARLRRSARKWRDLWGAQFDEGLLAPLDATEVAR